MNAFELLRLKAALLEEQRALDGVLTTNPLYEERERRRIIVDLTAKLIEHKERDGNG